MRATEEPRNPFSKIFHSSSVSLAGDGGNLHALEEFDRDLGFADLNG